MVWELLLRRDDSLMRTQTGDLRPGVVGPWSALGNLRGKMKALPPTDWKHSGSVIPGSDEDQESARRAVLGCRPSHDEA